MALFIGCVIVSSRKSTTRTKSKGKKAFQLGEKGQIPYLQRIICRIGLVKGSKL